ncbi:PilZ domain-containing protein [Shinella zoogloeoides]|uniref:PilZ domain-containing protein n=1 Tax=Shinella zoogloeoides TaxID=352475 RepID=A0A6N8TCB7_SHIZO|nr:PilZ domain-containing protein [Shinella zoogloeoides]MXN98843.1 PilZ domain-containing protein [Shinella zoogloeoides]UEX83290.1 PilZ domain-containing protein [Shinella zoogloeoides]
MYSFQQATPARKPQPDQRSFQRVAVNLSGRLMLASHDEYDCTVIDMSPGDASFVCTARPRMGERIIAYVDHLGRIEGTVALLGDQGFAIQLNATDRKREKLAAQLTWIANKHELGLPEDRLTPRNTRTDLTLDDGRRYPCRIIDLSLSGAAVDIDVRPALGTPVQLGSMKGKVVRHFQEGVAIEFSSVQSREALTSFL